jgi:Spy/CpxP family protein refolding chaperone
MNTRSNNKIILLTIAVILISISSAYAQQPDKRGWEEKKARIEAFRKELSEKLNLSPEQQKLLDANRTEHRQKMQAVCKNIREKRSELREELEKPTLDLEKIKTKHSELKTLFSSMLDLRLDGIIKSSKILTPEQRKIMSEFLKEKRKNFPPFGDRERMDVPPPPFDDMEGIDVPPPPHGDKEGMYVPPPPSGAMKGMDVPSPPPFAMMGMCVPPPLFGGMRGMDVPPPPFGDMEEMDDIMD